VTKVTIAVDAMGGDFGPHVVIPACKSFLKKYPDASIIAFGKWDVVYPLIADASDGVSLSSDRFRLVHVDQMIAMDDSPRVALRSKPASSMRRALECVRDGIASVCVSAGNTGALMALSVHVIGRLGGIERPAICSRLPTPGNFTYLLDLGANVDCSAHNLLQFAQMASTYVGAVEHKDVPSIALLNIGEEQIKGNAQVKSAAVLMADAGDLNYVGFVEGGDLFSGRVDVVVCDGFVGNIALKTSEGVARFIFESIKAASNESWLTRIVGKVAFFVFRNFLRQLDPRSLNGAVFLGLNGMVVKSHGNADVIAFTRSLDQAYEVVRQNVLAALAGRFAESAMIGEDV